LVADFMGSRRAASDPLSKPFTPGFARKLILGGLAKGWKPCEWVRKPVWMDEEEVRRRNSGP
jgi:hypothetical protein